MRLIDADALRAEFKTPTDWLDSRQVFTHVTGIWATIDCAPTIEECNTGKWQITDGYPHNVYCSECHAKFAQTHWTVWENGSLPRKFCPNCGAKMERGEE